MPGSSAPPVGLPRGPAEPGSNGVWRCKTQCGGFCTPGMVVLVPPLRCCWAHAGPRWLQVPVCRKQGGGQRQHVPTLQPSLVPLGGDSAPGLPCDPYLLVRGQCAGCCSPLLAGRWPQERCPRWKPNCLLRHSLLLVPRSRTDSQRPASGIKGDFSFKNHLLLLAAGPGEAQLAWQHPGMCPQPGTSTSMGWRQRE